MKITVSQLRRIIREEVERVTGAPLKDGGIVNRDSGEILDMDSVPPKYLGDVVVDEMGYTTLPHDKFEELRGELKGSSAGKPKKQWKAPFQLNREGVEKLSEARFKVGDMVEEKGTGSGWWEILELIPDNRTGKTVATLKMFQSVGGRTPTTYVTTDKLRKVEMKNESKGFDDYIRDVDRDMPTSWDSPDPQDVHDEFLLWRDRNGEVPLQKLAKELGVKPEMIDWNGTGLRVINGVVTELLGDTPYRTPR